jgi:2-oxoglutarate ferredoxin oxidoreductase subunit alpha
MTRVSLKVVGASGQGINSIGEIVARGLKRVGYCVFGYREYPSLIKGGHASYQLDVSPERIESTEEHVDILIALNHHGLQKNLGDLKQGGLIVHSTPDWHFPPEDAALLKKRDVRAVYLPVDDILKRLGAKPILGNVLIAAFAWESLGQDMEALKSLVGERFAKKKDLLEMNMKAVEEGYNYKDPALGRVEISMPKPVARWKDHMLITGSQAMGLGAIHAGVRLYAGYPMTPSSPLLSFIADMQNRTGMVVKQAEDEITAAQVASGAMFMGTRAMTATSGGGFDLMSETVSLNGIIENPMVFVLAQRPGPATGLPTWTAQGDLLMAVNTAHGEFARCVMAVSSATDAFHLMSEAFNLAERFQTAVIVMTDKQIAEALYTEPMFDQKKTTLDRGKLITERGALAKLKGADRYDPDSTDGVSPRWLPGAEAETYCAQGDEHNDEGTVDETAANTVKQFDKRLRKIEALEKALPEPELIGAKNPEILLVGWGSTKGAVLDALNALKTENSKLKTSLGYLHYTYLWPLKTKRFAELAAKAKKIILIEGNHQGQLGQLLRQQSGIAIDGKILKYDGRPFFHDELLRALKAHLAAKKSAVSRLVSTV